MLFIVAPRGNRRPQSWLILIPLLGVVLVGESLLRAVSSEGSGNEPLIRFVFITFAASWAILWLGAHWLATLRRPLAFAIALVVLLSVGVLSWISFFGLTPNLDVFDIRALIYCSIWTIGFLPALAFSALCCRKRYSPRRLTAWLLLWCVMVAVAITFVLGAREAASIAEGQVAVMLLMLVRALLVGAVTGVMLYLLSLPMMILAFRCWFYQERLQKNLSLEAETR